MQIRNYEREAKTNGFLLDMVEKKLIAQKKETEQWKKIAYELARLLEIQQRSSIEDFIIYAKRKTGYGEW